MRGRGLGLREWGVKRGCLAAGSVVGAWRAKPRALVAHTPPVHDSTTGKSAADMHAACPKSEGCWLQP